MRGGLALSMALMLLGLALKLMSGDHSVPAAVMGDLFKSGIPPGDRVMGFGIIVFAFTPAFRVLTLLILWFRERDWRFVVISAVVLILLGIAISLGGG